MGASYKCLLDLKKENLIKSVGVSNYTIEDIKQLEDENLELPVCNQIEINPWMWRADTINYCKSKGIVPMAYRGIMLGQTEDCQVLKDLCTKYNKTSAQVLGRWLLQQGCLHI